MSKYSTRRYNNTPEPEEDEEDYYSPTSWERNSFESDEDYQDRLQDQEDLLDNLN